MQAELVERARRGDHDAFASLAAAGVDRCYALAYRIVLPSSGSLRGPS
jgi:hypothetical protein